MTDIKILWIDDEIDLLKPHILFLERKNFIVETVNNGYDAIDIVKEKHFDIIFLDENMPGLSGLQTLTQIKNIASGTPVVMITKSEEETIMEEAIGSKISDYLIKPVNPNQILLSIKKNIDHKRLITQKTSSEYQAEFSKIGNLIHESVSYDDWINIYKKLVYWELELEKLSGSEFEEIIKMQKSEANNVFSKFIKNNYFSWFDPNNNDKPLLSPNLFKNRIFPIMEKGNKVLVLLIDNLRYDQWQILKPKIEELFIVENDELYYSILPTATQYARNSIFAGLMPSEIEKLYPEYWLNDEDEGGKNLYEEELIKKQISRFGLKYSVFYDKISNLKSGKKLVENVNNIYNYQLSVIVYNFVDMLSHARTEMEMIKELAGDESAYRSLTLSWFEHSSLFELLKEISNTDLKVIITTDHGTIRVKNPVKVIGDKNTNSNLRYKLGKNLNYKTKDVFECKDPSKAYLPRPHVSSSYIFACENNFFAYPNNFNYYVNYYKDTFQHGGVSLEEMIIPFIVMNPK